jgi:hypothetical protein
MKASYGAINEETLDLEDDQYRIEESSLIPSPEFNGNVKSTRYVKIFTFVVVVAILLGSTLYLSKSVRGNQPRGLWSFPEDNKIYRNSTKTVQVGLDTTLREFLDQLIWGESASEYGKESHPKPVNDTVEPYSEPAKPTKKPHLQPAKVPEPQLSVKTSEVSEK